MATEGVTNDSETRSEQKIRKNVEDGRFELISSDGQVISYATFTETEKLVTVPLVFTPPGHRGLGHAATLMAGLLQVIEAADQLINPVCSYAATYVNRHSDYQKLARWPSP